MKLNEFIQIQQQAADQVTSIFINIINYFTKYRVSKKQFDSDIQLLKLSNDKKQILKQKLQKNIDELRKKIALSSKDNNIKPVQFKNLDWRFQAQLCSKTQEKAFKPNILLNFQFHNRQNNKQINKLVNCDFANLKHIQQTLQQAFKLHRSNKFRLARNSSV